MSSLYREDLIRLLPFARRYARALTGSQREGDGLVADSLRDVLARDAKPPQPKRALYATITRHFNARTQGKATPALSHTERQLLLLTALEELPLDEAAEVVGLPADDAAARLTAARDRLREAAATDVLIIEDEPIIAMDIDELVTSCGHRVIGVAATESEAVAIARRERPGLILADINLGAGGDGAHAVSRILRDLDAPVIFVTAYPERLLTGEGLEPPFVITKPFEPLTLAIATFQAVTGGVRLD